MLYCFDGYSRAARNTSAGLRLVSESRQSRASRASGRDWSVAVTHRFFRRGYFFSVAGQLVSRVMEVDLVWSVVWTTICFAVGADVVADAGKVGQVELEEGSDRVDVEVRLTRSLGSHEAVSHGGVEEFVVAAEDGVPSASRGDLSFCAGAEGHNVDLGPSAFVGEVGEPAAIGREAAIVLAHVHVSARGRLEGRAVSDQGQHPIGKDSLFGFQIKGEIFSVRRPVDGGTVDIGVILIEHLFGMAAIEKAAAHGALAILHDAVSDLFSVGRPDGPEVIGPKGDAGGRAAGGRKYPDISCPRSLVTDRDGDGFSVGRKARSGINGLRTGGSEQIPRAVKEFEFGLSRTFVIGQDAIAGHAESAGLAQRLRIAGESEGARIEGLGQDMASANHHQMIGGKCRAGARGNYDSILFGLAQHAQLDLRRSTDSEGDVEEVLAVGEE